MEEYSEIGLIFSIPKPPFIWYVSEPSVTLEVKSEPLMIELTDTEKLKYFYGLCFLFFLKRQSRLQQTTNAVTFFPIFDKNKV